jgi:hypothetical protein
LASLSRGDDGWKELPGTQMEAAALRRLFGDAVRLLQKRIIPSAYRGEVATLFVALGKHLWGILDPGTNEAGMPAGTRRGQPGYCSQAAPTSRRGRSAPITRIDARSLFCEFPWMAAEAGLSTTEYLEEFVILERFWPPHGLSAGAE